MRRLLVVLSWIIIAASGSGHSASDADLVPIADVPGQENGQFYCPPGAKFCPVPGRDNTVFLDTHFGMDAATGEVKRYKGSVHPDEINDVLTTQETTLYVSPPISVENRRVPYPGAAPAARKAAVATRPAPVESPELAYASSAPAAPNAAVAPRPAPAAAVRAPEPARASSTRAEPESRPATKIPWWKGVMRNNPFASKKDGYVSGRATRESEVANHQVVKPERIDQPIERDKDVPWWKGGWFRGKKEPKDEKPPPSASKQPAKKTSSAGKSDDQPPPMTADDMWGDEGEYADYDDPRGYNQPTRDPYQQSMDPYQPDMDPYAYPESPQSAHSPLSNSAPQAGGFVGEAYTIPNSPPPSTPWDTGYNTYPSPDITYTPYPSPDVTYNPTFDGGFGQPFQPQPAGMPPPPGASPPAPPPAQARPASRSTGSVHFDNAVKLVKESRFAEAKSILLSETSSDPANPAVWRWLADSQYNLLELQDAIDSYQRALSLDPNDYYALRGQGFAYLHRGHELWRRMMDELKVQQRDQAASTFAQAHENYKKSLEKLGDCLRRAPNDDEAVYGEAMAAEGASRKLYSNAISYIKLGPENRERAELFAANCLQVINKGVDRAADRARSKPGDSGPRALLGGLYLRKAMLYHQLGKKELALVELKNSHGVQKSILDEIDKNNSTAQKGIRDCEEYWREWGGAGPL